MALEQMFRRLQELELLERIDEYTYKLNMNILEGK